jgi:hypothetical protein
MKSRSIAVLAVAALLSSCTIREINILPTADYTAIVTPGVGFYVETSTTTPPVNTIFLISPSIQFQAIGGAIGGVVTDYTVRYLDQSNNPLQVNGQTITGFTEGLGISVEPGRSCDAGVGYQCPLLGSKNLLFVPGPKTDGNPHRLITGEVANAYLATLSQAGGDPTNWKAEITFKIVDDNGASRQFIKIMNVQYPLKNTN